MHNNTTLTTDNDNNNDIYEKKQYGINNDEIPNGN